MDRLKQRLLQQPSTRIEQELQQRIESLGTDNRKLMESVDSVRASAEIEKQQQVSSLKAFQICLLSSLLSMCCFVIEFLDTF